ncbi:desulfoferrodoxin [Desulfoluna butyratoxydans]|uniref:Desulfoferrodoxin n=1 Tax=Desulfoluna butyratoxydans TaxID=231438 RepID=A0A4U8YU46_9BACT|nr:desulfoferrodoxin [Desulfoluna butyratoxydans]VFQ47414.1 desulfoferrodoxin [Desulfoluna butyratoxydans]
MMRRNQLYACEHCGNIVEIIQAGGPTVRCCGQAMTLLEENTRDASREKHVPVVAEADGGIRVSVGETAHPMTEEHWIPWIEVTQGATILRKHLLPGEKPEAFFAGITGPVVARAYCNLHGHWTRG